MIVRAIHLAHAASTDSDANLVGDWFANRKAGLLSVRGAAARIRQRARGQLPKRRCKKLLCSGIPIEERCGLTSQLLVRAAGLRQERVTFVGRPLQRSVAEFLEPSPAFCGTRHRENRSDFSAASPHQRASVWLASPAAQHDVHRSCAKIVLSQHGSTRDTPQKASVVVATIDGLEGRWARTAGYVLTLGQLKTPLPADFRVTYDLVAAANYTWGARGMTFSLSNGPASGGTGTFVSLRLRPGSGSGDGEAVLEARFPGGEGYLSGSKWFTVPGFFSKTQSKVAVMLVKQGERLQVFLNTVKVFESDKAIPAGLVFDQLSLQQGGTFDANSRMFISNVTILKQ